MNSCSKKWESIPDWGYFKWKMGFGAESGTGSSCYRAEKIGHQWIRKIPMDSQNYDNFI